MVKILVIDSDRSVRNILKERLEYEGYRVDTVQEYAEGVILAQTIPFEVVVCDAVCFYSPQENRPGSRLNPEIPMIIISREDSTAAAVQAVRNGALDYIPKPIDMNRMFSSIRNAIDPEVRRAAAEKALQQTKPAKQRNGNSRAEEIIGEAHTIRHVKHLIDRVGPSEARVLITGSNGTGKELVARWIHEKSARATAPFVEVNCAAIPSELIESELFGHEKGAFTSAIKQRKGKFEQADNGTLFMDEIGDMSLAAQAKVLRVLQEHKLSRVGSDHDLEVNVRVVAATNKDLREEIAKGNFREDLYHRLSVIIIQVPPLCERIDDIPLLVNHFISAICQEYDIPPKKIDKAAIEELKKMPWRGNIRELRNVVERLIILSNETITLQDTQLYALGVV